VVLAGPLFVLIWPVAGYRRTLCLYPWVDSRVSSIMLVLEVNSAHPILVRGNYSMGLLGEKM